MSTSDFGALFLSSNPIRLAVVQPAQSPATSSSAIEFLFTDRILVWCQKENSCPVLPSTHFQPGFFERINSPQFQLMPILASGTAVLQVCSASMALGKSALPKTILGMIPRI